MKVPKNAGAIGYQGEQQQPREGGSHRHWRCYHEAFIAAGMPATPPSKVPKPKMQPSDRSGVALNSGGSGQALSECYLRAESQLAVGTACRDDSFRAMHGQARE